MKNKPIWGIILLIITIMFSCKTIRVIEYGEDGTYKKRKIRLKERDKRITIANPRQKYIPQRNPFSNWKIIEELLQRDGFKGKKITLKERPENIKERFDRVKVVEYISYSKGDSVITNKTFQIEGEMVVKLKNTSSALKTNLQSSLNATLSLIEITSTEFVPNSDVGLIKFNISSRMISIFQMDNEIIRGLESSPDIEKAEPNYIYYNDVVSNDPFVGNQWYLNNTGQFGGTEDADIDAFEAWDITTGKSTIVIGVLDTGIDYNHPDLVDNIWENPGEVGMDALGNDKRLNGIDDDNNGYIDDYRGWNFYSNNNNPFDDNLHGTHCAGTIAASGNNSIGVSGVSWYSKLVPLKFLGASGSGSTFNAIAAIKYATAIGVDLTNNSWGGGGYNSILEDAIKEADKKGIFFIASAGNNSANNDIIPHYPSNYKVSNVISVVSTDNNDQLSSFSNYGASSTHIGAPGSTIYSTTPNNTYGYLSGTSMAAPNVSGTIALIKSKFPSLSMIQIKARLLQLGESKSSLNGKCLTGNRLNAYLSLQSYESESVPVGAIISYSGDLALIPDNWVICNGEIIKDPLSPLYNTKTPNLIDRFIMGTTENDYGSYGGFNEMPAHTHSFTGRDNFVSFGMRSIHGYWYNKPFSNASWSTLPGESFSFGRQTKYLIPEHNGESHGHRGGRSLVSGITQTGGKHDNRPAYYSVLYLIKIK